MSPLNTKIFRDEATARSWLEARLWKDGPRCPHCGAHGVGKITKLLGGSHRAGLHQCNTPACRQQFTVTVGTVFEQSKIPLTKWLAVLDLLTNKKRTRTREIRDLIDVSYKTAWFMRERLRQGIATGGDAMFRSPSGAAKTDEVSKRQSAAASQKHEISTPKSQQRPRPKMIERPIATATKLPCPVAAKEPPAMVNRLSSSKFSPQRRTTLRLRASETLASTRADKGRFVNEVAASCAKRPRGRPAYCPTDSNRRVVLLLSASGVPHETIAYEITPRCSAKTLRKSFSRELAIGRIRYKLLIIEAIRIHLLGRPAEYDAKGRCIRSEVPRNVAMAIFQAKAVLYKCEPSDVTPFDTSV